MNFDHTYIAIRKRNALEILDLSLHVIRDHFFPLLVLWLVGVVPFLTINWIAIRWMAADVYDYQLLSLYFFSMIVLIISQAQVATTFITNYLGQAIFAQRPSIASAIKSTLRVNLWFIWVHGFLRMVIPVFLITLLFRSNMDEETTGWICFLLICVALTGLLVRSLRPFASEILLLEKTPIRKTDQNQINYSLRSSSLHKAANSELLGRFILMALMSIPLVFSILGSLLLVDSWLNLHTSASTMPSIMYVPWALWMVAGILAVARFLSYIDIRIRQEGWEVELRLRAEAIRLEQALS